MWKDLAVAEMAKIRNEVEDVTRRAQAEFHQHGAVPQAADMGYQQTRRRQDAVEGMLMELRKAVEMVANPVAELPSALEMITNKMSKMQDFEEDLERTKRIVEALRARPMGSSEDPAQARQGASSGGTGMLGRIREALARGGQPSASGPNVDGGTHYRTQMDCSKMFDHRMAVNYPFYGKIKAEEWSRRRGTSSLAEASLLSGCWSGRRSAMPKSDLRIWSGLRMKKGRRRTFSASRKRFGRSSTAVCQAKARSLSGWSRTSTAWRRGGA